MEATIKYKVGEQVRVKFGVPTRSHVNMIVQEITCVLLSLIFGVRCFHIAART